MKTRRKIAIGGLLSVAALALAVLVTGYASEEIFAVLFALGIFFVNLARFGRVVPEAGEDTFGIDRDLTHLALAEAARKGDAPQFLVPPRL